MSRLFRRKNIESALERNGFDASAEAPRLSKVLGPFDLILMGVGAIIGTGIFVLTGTGAVSAGPALTLSFLIAGAACCLVALCYAELAAAVPISGSVYAYSYATIGELPAWVMGWILMLEFGLGTAAVAVGWSGYLQSLLHGLGLGLPTALTAAPGAVPGARTLFDLPAFIMILTIAAVLARGAQESSRLNNILVVIKTAVVLLFVAVGARHVDPANWTPFMPMGWSGTLNAAALVFFAFIGFDAVTSAAEEVRNPQRDLPIGILGSLFTCMLLYVVVAAVMTGTLHYSNFANSSHPVSLVLQHAGERWVAGLIDLGAILSMTTVILVLLFAQTRLIFAMSRDGLLPSVLSRLHPLRGTPSTATWAAGLAVAIVAALVPLRVLAELINIGTLTAFCMIAVTVTVMRHTHPGLPRPFRCPAVPWVPLLAIAMCALLMFNLRRGTWLIFSIWLGLGLLIYFGYARRHSKLQDVPLLKPDRAS